MMRGTLPELTPATAATVDTVTVKLGTTPLQVARSHPADGRAPIWFAWRVKPELPHEDKPWNADDGVSSILGAIIRQAENGDEAQRFGYHMADWLDLLGEALRDNVAEATR